MVGKNILNEIPTKAPPKNSVGLDPMGVEPSHKPAGATPAGPSLPSSYPDRQALP